MAEGHRMTAAQLADKLLADEHADVLRESVAWMAAQLMETDVAAQIGAELGERTPTASPTATGIAHGPGTPGSARSSWPSPSCGKARTSPAYLELLRGDLVTRRSCSARSTWAT